MLPDRFMKFLIIQTAFIGDVVLATPLIEKLKSFYPDAAVDFLLRKGNESLLENYPGLRRVLILDKKRAKYRHLLSMIREIRKERYDYVINVQRFMATGILTVMSGAKITIGFDKNPMSAFFSKRIPHTISADDQGIHEVIRNLTLIHDLTDDSFVRPRLFPSEADYKKIQPPGPYVCISPASVWFTKQWPAANWMELIRRIPGNFTIYLLGSKGDIPMCESIRQQVPERKVEVLAGQLTFLQSAALMKNAKMNFVNDSAPLHFATAVNAPVSAIFCSTVPAFGFGPLSDTSLIFETYEELDCRPCGLHGYNSCPKGHFKCSHIHVDQIIQTVFS